MSDRPYVPWTVIDAYQACTCRQDEVEDCSTCDALFDAITTVAEDAVARYREGRA